MRIKLPILARPHPGHTRRITAIGCSAVLALTIAACGSSSSGGQFTSGPADPNATVRVAWSYVPTQLDPLKSAVEPGDFRVLNLIYDRLLSISPVGEIEPALATNWEYGSDGLSLTLTLRNDVTFRDGTPLDASAVVTNLDRARSLGNRVSQRMSHVTQVLATSPYEVRLDLDQPTTELPAVLAQNAGMILNPNLLRNGDPAVSTDGTGPYVLEDFNSGSSLTLVRADDADGYWDPEAAQAARFEYTSVADPRALINALRTGQVDVAELTQPEQVDDLRPEIDRGDLEVTPVYQQTGILMYLNRKIENLGRIEVRQALSHALDRTSLVDNFYPGSDPAVQLWRESDPHYDPNLGDAYPYDPEVARKLLSSNGFPDGIDLGPMLVSNSMPASFAESVQAMLAESGINTQVQVMDAGQIFAEYAKGEAPLMLNYTSGYGSPAVTLINRTGPAYNPAGTNAEFDSLLAAANDNRLSIEQQTDKFRSASTYLIDDAWFAPIVWVNFPWVHTPALRGFSPEEVDYSSTTGPYDWRYIGLARGRSES